MSDTSDEITAANVAEVQRRIREAAKRSGRDPAQVRLLPVTKTIPAHRLRILPELGLHQFGENRVQELKAKSEELSDLSIDWVTIGHLQTNKAKQAARLATEVESVDSIRVALALNSASERLLEQGERTSPLSVLLQVNVSGEESKYGLQPEKAADAVARVSELPGLELRGFMTMAPFTVDLGLVRATFAGLRELRDHLAAQAPGLDLRALSMGMSHDYEIAVEEGSTIVRVGSAIFGSRV